MIQHESRLSTRIRFNLTRFQFHDILFEVGTDPYLMVIYYLFLYSGMAKFVADLQSERNFMVVVVDLLHSFADDDASTRTRYLDEMKTIANDMVEPLFEKDIVYLRTTNYTRDTSSIVLMPILPTDSNGILLL